MSLLLRSILYNIDTYTIWIGNGKMPVTPGFIAKFKGNWQAFIFEVFINLVDIFNFYREINAISAKLLMK